MAMVFVVMAQPRPHLQLGLDKFHPLLPKMEGVAVLIAAVMNLMKRVCPRAILRGVMTLIVTNVAAPYFVESAEIFAARKTDRFAIIIFVVW